MMKTNPTNVFLATPHYGQMMHGGCAKSVYVYPTLGDCRVIHGDVGSSLLARGFNMLWTKALCMAAAGKCTHFAMLHTDISAQQGWLDILLAECNRLDADVVSAVVALKDDNGETSTAIDDPDFEWMPLKRLSFAELAELPETFNAEDCGHPDKALLVNTGCWIADLRKPWCAAVDDDGTAKVCFTIKDRVIISTDENGNRDYKTYVAPEDWNFSRDLHRWGCSVYATTKVFTEHIGEHRYTNYVERVSALTTQPS